MIHEFNLKDDLVLSLAKHFHIDPQEHKYDLNDFEDIQ